MLFFTSLSDARFKSVRIRMWVVCARVRVRVRVRVCVRVRV